MMRLKNKTYVTQIMPQNNQPVCEHYLDAGTPIRNIHVTALVGALTDEPLVVFDANPDGMWFRYQTFGEPETV